MSSVRAIVTLRRAASKSRRKLQRPCDASGGGRYSPSTFYEKVIPVDEQPPTFSDAAKPTVDDCCSLSLDRRRYRKNSFTTRARRRSWRTVRASAVWNSASSKKLTDEVDWKQRYQNRLRSLDCVTAAGVETSPSEDSRCVSGETSTEEVSGTEDDSHLRLPEDDNPPDDVNKTSINAIVSLANVGTPCSTSNVGFNVDHVTNESVSGLTTETVAMTREESRPQSSVIKLKRYVGLLKTEAIDRRAAWAMKRFHTTSPSPISVHHRPLTLKRSLSNDEDVIRRTSDGRSPVVDAGAAFDDRSTDNGFKEPPTCSLACYQLDFSARASHINENGLDVVCTFDRERTDFSLPSASSTTMEMLEDLTKGVVAVDYNELQTPLPPVSGSTMLSEEELDHFSTSGKEKVDQQGQQISDETRVKVDVDLCDNNDADNNDRDVDDNGDDKTNSSPHISGSTDSQLLSIPSSVYDSFTGNQQYTEMMMMSPDVEEDLPYNSSSPNISGTASSSQPSPAFSPVCDPFGEKEQDTEILPSTTTSTPLIDNLLRNFERTAISLTAAVRPRERLVSSHDDADVLPSSAARLSDDSEQTDQQDAEMTSPLPFDSETQTVASLSQRRRSSPDDVGTVRSSVADKDGVCSPGSYHTSYKAGGQNELKSGPATLVCSPGNVKHLKDMFERGGTPTSPLSVVESSPAVIETVSTVNAGMISSHAVDPTVCANFFSSSVSDVAVNSGLSEVGVGNEWQGSENRYRPSTSLSEDPRFILSTEREAASSIVVQSSFAVVETVSLVSNAAVDDSFTTAVGGRGDDERERSEDRHKQSSSSTDDDCRLSLSTDTRQQMNLSTSEVPYQILPEPRNHVEHCYQLSACRAPSAHAKSELDLSSYLDDDDDNDDSRLDSEDRSKLRRRSSVGDDLPRRRRRRRRREQHHEFCVFVTRERDEQTEASTPHRSMSDALRYQKRARSHDNLLTTTDRRHDAFAASQGEEAECRSDLLAVWCETHDDTKTAAGNSSACVTVIARHRPAHGAYRTPRRMRFSKLTDDSADQQTTLLTHRTCRQIPGICGGRLQTVEIARHIPTFF